MKNIYQLTSWLKDAVSIQFRNDTSVHGPIRRCHVEKRVIISIIQAQIHFVDISDYCECLFRFKISLNKQALDEILVCVALDVSPSTESIAHGISSMLLQPAGFSKI